MPKFRTIKMRRTNAEVAIDEVGPEHLVAAIKKLMQDGYLCVQVVKPAHGKGYRVRGHKWESHSAIRDEVELKK